MIIFITTKRHSYTLGGVVTSPHRNAPLRVLSYENLFLQSSIRAATVVFTDFDRLRHFELAEAARIYRVLKAQGVRVLNDPARCRQRYDLLVNLHRSGLNAFQAYRANCAPRPSRFPVFLKCETDHRQDFDELIPDQATLDRRLLEVEEQGTPLRNMLVIEFANMPWRDGVFRRSTAYRIGEEYLAGSVVLEDRPFVKYGTAGLSTDEDFRIFAEEQAQNFGADDMRPVFDLARVDYGRVDYGRDGDGLAVYEINTNPTIGRDIKTRDEAFRQAVLLGMRRVVEAVCALDGEDRKAQFNPPRSFTQLLLWKTPRALRVP